MTKLQEIEQQIRKDIPRLMELTHGCIVENNYNKERSIYLGEVHQNETYKVFKDYNDGEIWIDYENYFWLNDYEDFAFTIIGHEIMINDVLEWLEYMRKHHDLCDYIRCDVSDNIFQIAVVCEIADVLSLHGFKEECKILKWDLSKLYLKDQSEELINFLHNLINQ